MSLIWGVNQKPEWRSTDPCLINVGTEVAHFASGAVVVVHSEPKSVLSDRFRFLRTRLCHLWDADKLKTLLITSPFPHDGKSTVALNLAIVLAEGGKRRVLLIEADLHYPTVAHRLGLDGRLLTGLADCLQGEADPFSAVRRIEPIDIYLLPAGRPSNHPTELLQSDKLSHIIQSLREHFDWMLIDSPPVKPLSDTLILRRQTDATLLVVRSGYTPGPAVDEAVDLIGKRHILGMVLNGVEGLERTYSRYYGSYGGQDSKK